MTELLGVSSLLFVLIASAAPAPQPLLRTTTMKSADAFASCFAGTQDKAAKAWAFLPRESGGTFTNVGASGTAAPYWVQVKTGIHGGNVRLFSDGGADASSSLIRAVEQCR